MPSLIEIILQATDQTGPAFASARANLQGLAAASQQMARGTTTAAQQVATGAQQTAQATRTATGARQSQTTADRSAAAQARQLATAQAQNARITRDIALASTDAAGKVRIWRQEEQRLETQLRQTTGGLLAQTRAENELLSVRRRRITAENVQNRGLGPALPRTLESFGSGALGQIGLGLGVAELGSQLTRLGQESSSLALRAQTIGTAYEEATQRAGVGADALMQKLRQASRGTIAEADLQLNANKALALGVGQNIGEIADLLAIARQRGKAMGIDTAEAFQRIVEGLGKAEPEILDELGILIDSNLVYKEYAKSIGVSSDALTKQQKVLAVTNAVLRDNRQLVAENAREQPDAADRVAQVEARKAEAKTRIGVAIQPAVITGLEATAAAFDAVTGQLNGEDVQAGFKALNQNLIQIGNPIQSTINLFRLLASAEENAIGRATRADIPEMRLERETNLAPFQAAAPTRRTGPYANTLVRTPDGVSITPQAQGAVINNYHIPVTVQGSVVTDQGIINGVQSGLLQKERQNGTTGIGMGTRRRGR